MTKKFTIKEIAEALEGRFVGDGALVVERVAHPADVRGLQDLALAMDKNLLPLLTGGMAVVSENAEVEEGLLKACVFVKRPRLAMARLTNMFVDEDVLPAGIHPTAVIEPSAKVGAGARIGAHVYIGPKAIIGDGALIYAGVRIGARVQIGVRCIVHFNASIGADGFSFVTPEPGSVETAKATGIVGATNETLVRIASLGAVVIGDDVEIGANTSIDNGTVAPTRIGNGTKIDNQVQVGHNVVIGNNCLICGRVGIAGSVEIGNRVVLGGAVGIADHVKIGDDVLAMAMSGIAGNVPSKTIVGGIPAKPRNQVIEEQFNIRRLKSLMRKVDSLTQRLEELEKGGKAG